MFTNMSTTGMLPCGTKQQNLPAKSETEQNSAGNLQIVYTNNDTKFTKVLERFICVDVTNVLHYLTACFNAFKLILT